MLVRKKNWLSFAVLSCFVMVSGSMVLAQGQNPPPGGGRGGFGGFGGFGGGAGGELMLLNRTDVQDALEMVEDQKEKLRTAMEYYQGKIRDMFTGMRDLSQEERTQGV